MITTDQLSSISNGDTQMLNSAGDNASIVSGSRKPTPASQVGFF